MISEFGEGVNLVIEGESENYYKLIIRLKSSGDLFKLAMILDLPIFN